MDFVPRFFFVMAEPLGLSRNPAQEEMKVPGGVAQPRESERSQAGITKFPPQRPGDQAGPRAPRRRGRCARRDEGVAWRVEVGTAVSAQSVGAEPQAPGFPESSVTCVSVKSESRPPLPRGLCLPALPLSDKY